MDGLRQDLQKRIAGEVRFDAFSRMLYSTDASIYQIEPIGVVIPRHADDVAATVEVARQHGVPVLPRGGGTGLAGQTVGKAIIIDMSNDMHQVLELNTEEHWAWVQPGVVQDQFNAYLRPHGLLFGPDTSTSSRAKNSSSPDCFGNIAASITTTPGPWIASAATVKLWLTSSTPAAINFPFTCSKTRWYVAIRN